MVMWVSSFMVRHAFLGSVKEENFGAGKSGCGLNSGVFLGPYHMARFWMKLLKQTSGVNNTKSDRRRDSASLVSYLVIIQIYWSSSKD
ncbi:hypothetical protein H5410_045383 [Solanum commersonii]|uniref:Uncharacterized protein n=1 Tax=Solanum commersonii TaxID=4109 RepID=A0A9J5XBG6_SOLCO|nr:hypothetical protein H5410_045383 [Solanum commersonii]